jgi:spore protease
LNSFIYGDKYTPVSDIACERRRASRNTEGIEFKIECDENFVWERLRITNKLGAAEIGKPIGRYDTLNTGSVHLLSQEDSDEAKNQIAKELCSLAEELGIYPEKILVAGLGNKDLTADSVGPKCVSRIKVSRQLIKNGCEELLMADISEISAIAPGVSQQSGIESYEIINGMVKTVMPDLVIAVDSIATASAERLGKCVQLCDTGIAPGSGVGGRRMLLNERSLGVPVIALGAPTVINSRLLSSLDDSLKELRDELFLSPREIDIITDSFAEIIAGGINQAFGFFE